MKFKNGGWQTILTVLASALLVAGIYFLLPNLLIFLGEVIKLFMPFVLGYLFSLLINPLADKLQNKFKLPRGLSAILVIILTVGIFGGIITGIIWKIISEIRSVYMQYPLIYEGAVSLWESISMKFSSFYVNLPDNVQSILDTLGNQVSTGISEFFKYTPVVEKAGNFAKGLPGIFISFIVFFLSLYFMITDAKSVNNFFRRIFPKKVRDKFSSIRIQLKKYLGGYVKAQAIIMSIAFLVIFTGLSILKVDYALIIAIGIAFLDALPFFGSGAVLWPWAIISFINGSVKMGVGMIIIYLAIVFTRQMIEPKIVSTSIGMHPILTLMSMYVGYKTFSVGGMILGPILLILIISFYKAGILDPIINIVKLILRIIKVKFTEIKNTLIK